MYARLSLTAKLPKGQNMISATLPEKPETDEPELDELDEDELDDTPPMS